MLWYGHMSSRRRWVVARRSRCGRIGYRVNTAFPATLADGRYLPKEFKEAVKVSYVDQI